MIEIGIDPVNTAKRLGHAGSQMTLDTYSHSTAAGEERTDQSVSLLTISAKEFNKIDVEDFQDGIKNGIKSKNPLKKAPCKRLAKCL